MSEIKTNDFITRFVNINGTGSAKSRIMYTFFYNVTKTYTGCGK